MNDKYPLVCRRWKCMCIHCTYTCTCNAVNIIWLVSGLAHEVTLMYGALPRKHEAVNHLSQHTNSCSLAECSVPWLQDWWQILLGWHTPATSSYSHFNVHLAQELHTHTRSTCAHMWTLQPVLKQQSNFFSTHTCTCIKHVSIHVHVHVHVHVGCCICSCCTCLLSHSTCMCVYALVSCFGIVVLIRNDFVLYWLFNHCCVCHSWSTCALLVFYL